MRTDWTADQLITLRDRLIPIRDRIELRRDCVNDADDINALNHAIDALDTMSRMFPPSPEVQAMVDQMRARSAFPGPRTPLFRPPEA